MEFKKNFKLFNLFLFLFIIIKSLNSTANAVEYSSSPQNLKIKAVVPSILELTLSTNNLDLSGFNATDLSTGDVEVLVNSSSSYDLSVKLDKEIKSIDGSEKIIDKRFLKIRYDSTNTEYVFTEINSYINLTENYPKGNKRHYLTLMFYGDATLEKGDYKTSLTFQATQR